MKGWSLFELVKNMEIVMLNLFQYLPTTGLSSLPRAKCIR